MADRSAITRYRSVTGQAINKLVRRMPDGTLEKGMIAHRQDYLAETLQAPDLETLAELLRAINERSDCAVSTSLFVSPPVPEWLTIARKRLAAFLGVDEDKGRHTLVGWHQHPAGPVCARLKENQELGCWLTFDRDFDAAMPGTLAAWTFDDWCLAVDRVWPGFAACGKVVVPSTTGRVLVDGQPLASRSCHVFVRVVDPDDIPRAWSAAFQRTAITACAPRPWDDESLLAFGRPRHSRVTGEVLGLQHWTVYDRGTAHVNRMFYDGAPVVEGRGLDLASVDVRVIAGGPLDTSRVADITAKERKAIAEATLHLTGHDVRPEARYAKTRSGRTVISGVDYHVADLEMGMVVDTDDGPLSIREITAKGTKVRCQTPYRDSTSMAAFVNFFRDGSPYLYDSGTCELHVLQPDRLDYTWKIIKGWLLQRYEPKFIGADGAVFTDSYGRVRESTVKPNPEIIKRMVLACDVPRAKEDGRVVRDQLPACFKKWLPVAWGALQDELLPEGADMATSGESIAELEVSLDNLLSTQVTINAGMGEVRNSIGAWARYFATIHRGRWFPVRTYPIWGHIDDEGNFRIAFRPSLASVLKVCPEIAAMSSTKLTRLCNVHGFAERQNVLKVDGSNQRATVLSVACVHNLGIPLAVVDVMQEHNEILKNSSDTPLKGGGGFSGGNLH